MALTEWPERLVSSGHQRSVAVLENELAGPSAKSYKTMLRANPVCVFVPVGCFYCTLHIPPVIPATG